MEINITKLKTYAENISVLYVEDDEEIQEEIARVLTRFFPKVDLSQNGEDGLFIYNENPHDLVISDINMPIMNGIEMIKELKKYENPPTVLVTSAYNDTDYLMELINLNITQFVMKPFNAKQFLIGLYSIVEKIFYKKEYLIMQEKLRLSNQSFEQIQENSEHAMIILQKDKIKSANTAFLKLSEYSDIQSLKDETPPIASLFDSGYNCIQAQDNKDFISELLTKDKSMHLVQKDHGNRDKPSLYAIGFTEISKSEEAYLLSFTDITPYLEPYKFNRTTQLPNRIYMMEEVQSIRIISEDIYAIAISIKHFNEYSTWTGKQGAKDFERIIAEQLNDILEKNNFSNIFLAHFGVNQFLLLSSSTLEPLIPKLKDIQLHPVNLAQEKQKEKHFSFDPLFKDLTFSTNLELEALEILLINTYDELHF